MLKIIAPGVAAGGGFPQRNCNCDLCRAARADNGDAVMATQSSLAVTADGGHWFLLNASPDLRQQINQTPTLHPRRGRRHSPIAGVVLTNADVDHVAAGRIDRGGRAIGDRAQDFRPYQQHQPRTSKKQHRAGRSRESGLGNRF